MYGCFIDSIYGFSLIQSVAPSLINAITGKGVTRTGKGQEGGFLSLLALPLIIKVMSRKEVTRAERGQNNMDQMFKKF